MTEVDVIVTVVGANVALAQVLRWSLVAMGAYEGSQRIVPRHKRRVAQVPAEAKAENVTPLRDGEGGAAA